MRRTLGRVKELQLLRVPEATEHRRRNRPPSVLLLAGSLLVVIALAFLSACTTSPSPSPKPQSMAPSGISGNAVIGGGPVGGPGLRAYSYAVVVVSGPGSSREATRVATGEDGAFRVELRPGVYHLALVHGSVDQTVTVEQGKFATATLALAAR